MLRRVHVRDLRIGNCELDADAAHHLRDVLRLTIGTQVQLFDSAGSSGIAIITAIGTGGVTVNISSIESQQDQSMHITIAAAIPKGDRADWMIEKLSELGVNRFVPLACERSVVLPAGRNKISRWERLAIEAAKQSRRAGVMTITGLTPLADAIRGISAGWYLSTAEHAAPIASSIVNCPQNLTLLIGPEGGWTDGEIAQFDANGLVGVGLTNTILRVETAAITAAAVVICGGRKITA